VEIGLEGSVHGSDGNETRRAALMPRKIRELKADLRRAGFVMRPGKGSHTVWEHPAIARGVPISGRDSDDAHDYQEKDVRAALARVREVERNGR